VYQIDIKFDRQLRPATETLRVVSYGGKTFPRWRTAAILKIDISPYLSEKSSDFDEILYTAAEYEPDERHVIKTDKLHWTDSESDRTYFLFFMQHSSVEHDILRWRHYYVSGKGITQALLVMQLLFCPEWTRGRGRGINPPNFIKFQQSWLKLCYNSLALFFVDTNTLAEASTQTLNNT